MTTLRSMVACLALMIRCAGAMYIVVQVVIWHSFYSAGSWRLAAPAVAVAWALAVAAFLRKRWPSPALACADSAVYVALALAAQACVPPAVRDDTVSWLVIAMSGQLMVSGWCAPGVLSLPLALMAPLSFWAGAARQPVTDARTLAGATMLLIVVGLVHAYGRRQLYGRAVMADAALSEADQAAGEQYAILSRGIERREHERLLHDTVLNTLTALARAGSGDAVAVLNRCRQDVALIEGALGEPDDLAAGARRPPGDLPAEMRAVIADMRARGLTIHGELDDGGGHAIPERVIAAISNAAREALSNVAAHAGTGEAWVRVSLTAPAPGAAPAPAPGAAPAPAPAPVAGVPCLRVIVRDEGAGFDPARVDRARLGLRRSIAERAADCGGQASVWSRPGRGTVVCLAWPASQPPDDPEPGAPADPRLAGGLLARPGPPW
jgi:signal transduction histidine kinase